MNDKPALSDCGSCGGVLPLQHDLRPVLLNTLLIFLSFLKPFIQTKYPAFTTFTLEVNRRNIQNLSYFQLETWALLMNSSVSVMFAVRMWTQAVHLASLTSDDSRNHVLGHNTQIRYPKQPVTNSSVTACGLWVGALSSSWSKRPYTGASNDYL